MANLPSPALVHHVLVAVTMTPDPSQLPGGQVLQRLTDGLGGWALAHSQNYQQSYSGRKAVLVSGFAALLIGAGPAIVNFFFAAGQGVH